MAHCGECGKDFCKTSILRVHVKKKHPDKLDQLAPLTRNPSGSGNYPCNKCSKCFANFGNLRLHVKQKHSDKLEKLAPLKKKNYKCDVCNCQFDLLKQLMKHRSSHNIRKTMKCSLCQYSASTDILVQHYKIDHTLEIINETLDFDSIDAFKVWKSRIEEETFASFVQTRGAEKTSKHTKTTYFCHRSGYSRTRGKHIRKPKISGSNKIGGYCPARMIVSTNNEKCIVQFCKSHVGHAQEKDMGHLFLTTSQRETIASKIAAKIPLQVILDEVRNSITDCSLQRIHLLTRKDLYNIEYSFNLKDSSIRHANDGDAMSVDAWVNELSDSVLFYKSQKSLCEEYPELKSSDFILIIMTDSQQDLLGQFGSDCICIDGTHGVNAYGFELQTILVLDDLREGYPCAFLISNRSDVAVLKLFFSSVEKRIGRKIRPRVFMSDMAESYYNAWMEVMLPAEFRLFCTWHVDRAWNKSLDKIVDKEKKVLIYQMLRVLLQETDVRSFQCLLQKFLLYCRASSDTLEFAIYFENIYSKRPEQWAYCYRLNSGLNTNMHMERMHRTLKYLYLHRKFVKRLDKAIGAIMKFLRDKLFERLIVLLKGKVCTKLSTLRRRHKSSEDLPIDSVAQKDMEWLVPSASRNAAYHVKEIKSDCSCRLVCDECKTCIHRYSCTCIDNTIQWNMCKHIHLVCKFIKQFQVPDNEVQQSMLSEEKLIDINQSHVDISGSVKNLCKVKPVSDVQQRVDVRRIQLLQDVKDELLRASSLEEIEAAERILAPLKPTLAVVRRRRTHASQPEHRSPKPTKKSQKK